jgi:hypothetical protein
MMSDKDTRVREAEEALVLWKVWVIRNRRWRRRGYCASGLAMAFALYSLIDHRAVVVSLVCTIVSLVVYTYVVVIASRERNDAHLDFVQAIRALDYGDDDARAGARRLVQDASTFDNR